MSINYINIYSKIPKFKQQQQNKFESHIWIYTCLQIDISQVCDSVYIYIYIYIYIAMHEWWFLCHITHDKEGDN